MRENILRAIKAGHCTNKEIAKHAGCHESYVCQLTQTDLEILKAKTLNKKRLKRERAQAVVSEVLALQTSGSSWDEIQSQTKITPSRFKRALSVLQGEHHG